MSRFWHWYYRFNRGPHGKFAVAMLAVSVVLSGVLLGRALIIQRTTLIEAFAFTAVLAGLSITVVILNLLRAKVNDVHYSISLESALRRTSYEPVDFYTDGGAASPSLQLLQMKILSFCRPQHILELGSGQSTKLLSYYARENPEASVLTLEQDFAWTARLKDQVSHDYRHAPLEPTDFVCAGTNLRLTNRWYHPPAELAQRKFDYILVDGPDPGTLGTAHTDYARCGILKYLPEILAPSFVIVFDDAERYGEIMTVTALEKIFQATGVQYRRFSVLGVKTQVVFCSNDRAFLQSV